MNVKRSSIWLKNIQIKNEDIFHELCRSIERIEEYCGIFEVEIGLENVFFCPWINKENCKQTPMERLVLGLIERMR
ncbi:MAG: hypothetical protein ACM31M_00365 [Nitrososphaerota archaeon]